MALIGAKCEEGANAMGRLFGTASEDGAGMMGAPALDGL